MIEKRFSVQFQADVICEYDDYEYNENTIEIDDKDLIKLVLAIHLEQNKRLLDTKNYKFLDIKVTTVREDDSDV